ncbi:MAG TPA: protein kinase [Micromonospora sp.]
MSNALPQLVADRYRLIEPLGQGGMGRVWKARDEVLHRDVAIKELVPPPGLTDDERREMRERSLREARAIARLNHVNVVRVFDVLRTDGDPWIVMEYVPSRSLQDVLAADGPVSTDKAAEIGLGVLGALKAAHRAGVMHRDVKPGNVLLGDDGRVVLTDFGLATVPGDPNVTRTGLVLGSPAYIAPERAKDGTAGPEGDLWSLGATLYAAVEGQSPYARPSAIATLAALATEPPPPPKNAGPLKPVLAGLLRKDPTQRMSAEAAERVLRRLVNRRQRTAGISLLDGVRRPGPNGPRQDRTKALPAPRTPEKETSEEAASPTPVSPPVVVPDLSPEPPTEKVAQPEPPTEPVRDSSPTVVAPAAPTQRVDSPPAMGRAPSVAPQPRPAGDKRKWWLLAGLAALLLLVFVVIVPMTRSDDSDNEGAGTRTPSAEPSSAGASAPPASSAPPSAAPTSASPSPSPTGPVLPAGWRLYKDATGFSVPVPEGWRVERDPFSPYGKEDVRVYFRDPKSARFLLIDQNTSPRPDPVADWTAQEARRKGNYRDYQRVTIQKVDYFDNAADWEWTYLKNGVRLHVRNRGFVTAKDKAYGMYWSVPAATWDQDLAMFKIIADGFVPVRN